METIPTWKKQERAELEKQVAEYLRSGGMIEPVPERTEAEKKAISKFGHKKATRRFGYGNPNNRSLAHGKPN
nr:hypothetical protein 2 [bacterium]